MLSARKGQGQRCVCAARHLSVWQLDMCRKPARTVAVLRLLVAIAVLCRLAARGRPVAALLGRVAACAQHMAQDQSGQLPRLLARAARSNAALQWHSAASIHSASSCVLVEA